MGRKFTIDAPDDVRRDGRFQKSFKMGVKRPSDQDQTQQVCQSPGVTCKMIECRNCQISLPTLQRSNHASSVSNSFGFELRVRFCFEARNHRFAKWKVVSFASCGESANESPSDWRTIFG